MRLRTTVRAVRRWPALPGRHACRAVDASRRFRPPLALILARRARPVAPSHVRLTENHSAVRTVVRPLWTSSSTVVAWSVAGRSTVVRAVAPGRRPVLTLSTVVLGRPPVAYHREIRLLPIGRHEPAPPPGQPSMGSAGPTGRAGPPGPVPALVPRRSPGPAPALRPSAAAVAEAKAPSDTAVVPAFGIPGPAGVPGAAPDLDEITTQVLRRIERRAIAQRERMGHG